MKYIKIVFLSLALIVTSLVSTAGAIAFTASEYFFLFFGDTQLSGLFHHLAVLAVQFGHEAFDIADAIMGFAGDDIGAFAAERKEYSVAYFDPAWNNLSSSTVKSHCSICAQHDAYTNDAANYASVVVEAI